jgi:hypothetical protein
VWRERHGEEAGTALMLMPAGVLIVLVLGALAVDSAILFLGERELADLTAAAANDAATVALLEEPFYRCGRLQLDEDEARTVAATVTAARSSDAVSLTEIDVMVDNTASPPEVTVAAAGTVRLVFTPALPGGSIPPLRRSTRGPARSGACRRSPSPPPAPTSSTRSAS